MKKYIIVSVLLVGAITTQAQVFKTDESISSQLKNNNQPGMKYAAEAKPAKPVSSKATEENSMTLVQKIKEGKLGMPVKTGGALTQSKPVAVSKPAGVTIASEQSAAEANAKLEAAAKAKTAATVALPSQEEKSKEAKPVVENKEQ